MKTHFYNAAHYSPYFYAVENFSLTSITQPSNTIVSKPKIFYIHGNGTNKLKQKAENYLLREKALSKFSQVINIGNRNDGFDPLKLESVFARHLTPNDHHVNIIIYAHGGSLEYNEKFYFELSTFQDSYQHSILGIKLFQLIREATAGKPLKILVQSCHSNLLQNDLSCLPISSMLITMANEDNAFYTEDSSSNNPNYV